MREDYELYQEKYPLIEEIADMGAELETLEGEGAETVLVDIKGRLNLLKQQVAYK